MKTLGLPFGLGFDDQKVPLRIIKAHVLGCALLTLSAQLLHKLILTRACGVGIVASTQLGCVKVGLQVGDLVVGCLEARKNVGVRRLIDGVLLFRGAWDCWLRKR